MKTKIITKIPVPAQVLTRIKQQIQPLGYSAEHEAKLYGRLLELWYTIYNAHQREKVKLEDNFHNDAIDRIYTGIPTNQLAKFAIMIDGHYYQYTNLLSILENADVITVNDKYSVGRFPKSYRPHTDIVYDKISILEVNISNFVEFMSMKNTREEKLAEYPHLAQHINTVYDTTVDLDQAFQIIADSNLDPQHRFDYQIRALRLSLGIHFFTEADSGRLYTSVANFPKLLLPALRLYGQPLIEIDITNSQPFLLAVLMGKSWLDESEELDEYVAHVCCGEFYEQIAASLDCTRKEAKQKVFELFFSPVFTRNKALITHFEAHYPGVLYYMQTEKFTSFKKAEAALKADPTLKYRQLWFKLQALEADIVITAVEAMNIPALTRHDSILIQWTEDVDIAIDKLLEEFSIHTTITPVLDITNY